MIFGRNLLYVFWVSLHLVVETFLILRSIQRDIIINVHISVFMYSACYSCQILMKLEISWQSLKKYGNVKFHESLSVGGPVVPGGRTEGLTDVMKIVVAHHNFANTPSKGQICRQNNFWFYVLFCYNNLWLRDFSCLCICFCKCGVTLHLYFGNIMLTYPY
jgi:hypothetical protein